jgi:uracil-DNA glycosylase family 4
MGVRHHASKAIVMEGFFSVGETQDIYSSQGKPLSCFSCGLSRGVRTPKMEPYGNFKKFVMVIGSAPNKYDDVKGIPWQGKAGRLLEETLDKLGLDLFEDCLSINAVSCRPPDDRSPKPHELNSCRDIKLLKVIKEYNPNVIILLGNWALKSLLGHRFKKNLKGIDTWRGWCIPDRDFKAWVCPTFSPEDVTKKDSKEVTTIWEQDLKRIIDHIDKPRRKYKRPVIHNIDDLSVLDEIKNGMISFDFETTGIKPHSAGHRVVSCAVAIDENTAYSFVLPERKSQRKPLVRLLESTSVDKIGALMKFEDHWATIRLGATIRSWIWDVVVAAHILDNRPGVTSVKFQTYVQLGIIDYASEVTPYFRAKGKGANEINRIMELFNKPKGVESLLKYNGLDSIYEYRLGVLQMNQMNYDFLPF